MQSLSSHDTVTAKKASVIAVHTIFVTPPSNRSLQLRAVSGTSATVPAMFSVLDKPFLGLGGAGVLAGQSMAALRAH
jgi:hypothetical protein